MFKTINGGKLPTRGSKYSACVDLYANADVTIGAGETVLIPLGVCIDEIKLIESVTPLHREHYKRTGNFECFKNYYENLFLPSHYLQLMLRSSLSKHLIIANGVGVIDMDFSDEIMIRVHNPHTENLLMSVLGLWTKRFRGSDYKAEQRSIETENFKIKKGDRVAQITLLEHKGYLFDIQSEDERDGGFGSTGE